MYDGTHQKNVHDIHLHALLNESAHKPLNKEPYHGYMIMNGTRNKMEIQVLN